MAKKTKKRKKKVVVKDTAKISRAGRDSKGRKTKYYRPYKPRKPYQKRKKGVRKQNPFIYFMSCLAGEIRRRELKASELISVEGVTNFKNHASVAGYVWKRLAYDEKKNLKYLCNNIDTIFDNYFITRPDRQDDINRISKYFEFSEWYNVRHNFLPELFTDIAIKENDRIFLSGFVNGYIPFFDGKWIEFEKDFVTADMFYSQCNNVFNNKTYIKIFRSPPPALTLLETPKLQPDGSLWLFYGLAVNNGLEIIRGYAFGYDMSRDDTLIGIEQKPATEQKPETQKTEGGRELRPSEIIEVEREKTRQAEEKTKQMKMQELKEFREGKPKPTPAQILEYAKLLGLA